MAEAVVADRLPYVTFVECRSFNATISGMAETIVIDVEVERPQKPANDVRKIERIAITFTEADARYPDVLALRDDFPRVAHTNVRNTEFPRSLCLYDQPWNQIRIRWTAAAHIERIRFWLAETAKGTLHQNDQPLEQLLVGTGYQIVLPANYFGDEGEDKYKELRVRFASTREDCKLLIAEKGDGEPGLEYLALSFVADPQMHGVIRNAPQNLHELNEFLTPAGVPIIEHLLEKLQDWNKGELLDKRILLIVAFPLTRDEELTVEATNIWAFMTISTVREVGIEIGLWDDLGGHSLGTPIRPNPEADARKIQLEVVFPYFSLTRGSAAAASDVSPDTRKCIAIGAGALGSQVMRLLAQSGFGRWTIIDEDTLLPHNVARHVMNSGAVGYSKALTMAFELNSLYFDEHKHQWFQADLLQPGPQGETIAAELADSDLILDFAASIPVSRYLARDAVSNGRSVAAFLNPKGMALVLLVEDANRTIRLDSLEMQYYRAITRHGELANHLEPADGLRYARSCRDVSSMIPNHAVALHAAIAARAIRQAVEQDDAQVRIWIVNPDTLEVRNIEVPVATSSQSDLFGGWTLVVDEQLTRRLAELRTAKLPHETGGVLLGSFDLARKILYAVDTIPSPPDSEEWPTLYIRGKRGLKPQVDKVQELTGGQLEYVGEWHSHPDGCACLPSDLDIEVFGWLTKNMDQAGLPALMGISGENHYTEWYLCQMLKTGGWGVRL